MALIEKSEDVSGETFLPFHIDGLVYFTKWPLGPGLRTASPVRFEVNISDVSMIAVATGNV